MANELSMARPYVDVYGALEEGRQRGVARRQEEEANALAQAIRAASARAIRNGMVDPRLLGEELAQSGYAYAIPSAQEKLFATQKAAGEATEAAGKGEQAQIKAIGDKMQSFRQRLPVNNPRLLPAWVEAVYADPDLGPFMSQFGTKEEVIAGIPQDAAGVAQWMEGASMAADEVMKRRVPSAESMLQYTQPLSSTVEAQKVRIAGAGAARTTVNLPPAGKKFSETLGETAGKRLDKYRDNADSAVRTIETSQQLLPLLDDPKFISGTFADARLALARAAGIDVSATEAYFAAIGQQVAERITAFGAGTGLSDADREFAKSIAGGNPITTAKGIRDIIRINNESAQNVIKRYNEERTRLAKTDAAVLDYYPEINVAGAPTTALSADDQEALNWANANPRDPRAAQIKQRLGVP